MVDKSLSGLFKSFNALFAPLCGFFAKFFNLILFAAIIPVSEPEKKPLKINKKINNSIKKRNEGSSCIKLIINYVRISNISN